MPLIVRLLCGRLFSQKVPCIPMRKLSVKCRNFNTSSVSASAVVSKNIKPVKELIPAEGVVQSELVSRTENESIFKTFKTSPTYKATFFSDSEISVESCSPVYKDLLEIVSSQNVQSLCSVAYKDFRSKLIESIPKLSDKELAGVLNQMKNFPKSLSPMTPEFHSVWNALDMECISRLPAWGLDFALSIDTLWYDIYLTRFCEFHWALKRKLFRKCDKLTKEQYIRFLNNIIVGRTIPEILNSYDLEHKLYSVIEDLTLEETVVVALAFFKTETRIQDAVLLQKLLQKVMQNAGTIDSISTSSVAKLARHSSNGKFGLVDFYRLFQEKFIPEVDRLSVTACTHLGLIGTQLQAPNKNLLEKVLHKVEKEVHETRLKEFERLTLVMTTFNVDCDSLCHKIVDELRDPRRQEEVSQYGRSLPSILHYLSFRKIFPLDLISKIFSPQYLRQYYGKSKARYQREMLSLDITIGIELPDYKGPRLEDKLRTSLLKQNYSSDQHPKWKKNLSKYQEMVTKVHRLTAEILGGQDFVHTCNVLPQYPSLEIVFCTDDQGKYVKVPSWIKDRRHYELKFIPEKVVNNNIVYHALCIVKRGACIVHTSELLGHAQLHLRLLEKIGYIVHTIHANEFIKIVDNESEVRRLLSETLLTYRSVVSVF